MKNLNELRKCLFENAVLSEKEAFNKRTNRRIDDRVRFIELFESRALKALANGESVVKMEQIRQGSDTDALCLVGWFINELADTGYEFSSEIGGAGPTDSLVVDKITISLPA